MKYDGSLLHSLIACSLGASCFFSIDCQAESTKSGIPSFFIFVPVEGDMASEDPYYPVNGEEENYQDVPPSSVTEDEKYPINGEEPKHKSIPFGSKNKKSATLSTYKCMEKNPGFFLTADYLLWSFTEDQLEFAYVANETITLDGDSPSKIKSKDQDFDWNSGFRLGVGGRLPYDNWDLYLNWTYFNFTNDTSTNHPSKIIPVGALPTTIASSAKAQWHLLFETLDLELGRTFEVSRYLVFRPFLGVEGALINQRQKIVYGDVISNAFFAADHVRRKSSSLAIGPRMGINTRWLLGAGLGLVGNISGALLYSKFDMDSRFSNDFQALNLKNNMHLLRPNVQIALGVDWAYCFNNKQVLWLGANYETQFWWSQWLSPTVNSFRTNGDLGSQGLTLQFRFDF